MPRIAAIHAVYAAMPPVGAAFKRRWPEARLVNIVDDALPADLAHDGRLTDAMHARIRRLAEHAWAAGADAVLFTCSAFGPAIASAAAALPIPVLKPNEAMFQAALGAGSRIGMVATFAPAVGPMEAEFRSLAEAGGVTTTLQTICVPTALAAARGGDVALHDRLVAQAAQQLAHCDAVMLAQFSTSTAVHAVQHVIACPVLCAPEVAVDRLRAMCAAREIDASMAG